MDDINLTSVPGMIGLEPDDELVWYSVEGTSGTIFTFLYTDYTMYRQVEDHKWVKNVTRLYSAPDFDAAMIRGTRLLKAHYGPRA